MFDEERAGTDGQPQPRSAGLSGRAHGTGKQQGFRVTRTGKWSHEEIAERIGGAASIQHKELLGTRQKLTTALSSPLPRKKEKPGKIVQLYSIPYFSSARLRKNSVKQRELLKSLGQIYFQHNMRDWVDNRSRRIGDDEMPRLICSEGLM